MGAVTRNHEIRRRRKRRNTQRQLKARLLKAKNSQETERLMRKFREVATAAHLREFTAEQNRGGHTHPHKKAA